MVESESTIKPWLKNGVGARTKISHIEVLPLAPARLDDLANATEPLLELEQLLGSPRNKIPGKKIEPLKAQFQQMLKIFNRIAGRSRGNRLRDHQSRNTQQFWQQAADVVVAVDRLFGLSQGSSHSTVITR